MHAMRNCLLAPIVALCLTTPARAALDYYLELEGIDGEVTALKYRDWIAVTSYAFGASISGSGSGSNTHKVNLQDFSFTKLLDSASPKIFEYLVLGTVIPKAQLDIVDTGLKAGETLFSYLFEDVVFTAVFQGGAAQQLPAETVAFRFDEVTLTTFKNEKGGITPVIVKYDVKQAAPVPEPSSWAMITLGLVTLGLAMRRTRTRARH